MIRPSYWGVVVLSKFFTLALLATTLAAGTAQAQSLAQLGGPANLPPAGFQGQQFVDSRGCLFMRAGFGGNVTWVPRVNGNHQPICGYPPSFDAQTLQAVEKAMAPDPEARATDIAAPAIAAPAAPALSLTSIPKPPKGYRLAWTDDRLNPMRGIGTPEGQAQQDLVWTREVPAALVQPAPKSALPGRVSISTMSAPAPQAVAEGRTAFVQVGTFGVAANADGAGARLLALGLPVATTQITHKGRLLTVVYAGPFLEKEPALQGLAAARAAGFNDAVLRMK